MGVRPLRHGGEEDSAASLFVESTTGERRALGDERYTDRRLTSLQTSPEKYRVRRLSGLVVVKKCLAQPSYVDWS